jgi:hypothetical protein
VAVRVAFAAVAVVGSLAESGTTAGVSTTGASGCGASGSALVAGAGAGLVGVASGGVGVSCALRGFAEKARTAAIAVEARRMRACA